MNPNYWSTKRGKPGVSPELWWTIVLYLIIFLLATWCLRSSARAEGVTYHPLKSTRELVTTKHTHVQVQATVLAVITEDDGDLHIRLTDGSVRKCDVPAYMAGACIVAEIRPGTNTYRPTKGDTVTVRGVSRYDREIGHQWYEIHPVDSVVLIAAGR